MRRPSKRRPRMPLLNPAAVDSYLNAPRDSHDWLKTEDKAALQRMAHDAGMRFATDPWAHQWACFALGMHFNNFLFYLKMGGGKSKIILDQVRYRKRLGQLRRGIVVLPQIMHVHGFEEQIQAHAPDLTYQLLLGERDERERVLRQRSDLIICNMAALGSFMGTLAKAKGRKRREMQVDPKVGGEFAAQFNFLAIDEIHRWVDTRSFYYEMLWWLSCASDFRYATSGTAHGRDPAPLFGQFKLIDHGETLGTRVGIFRQAFYTPKEDYWAGVKWTFDQGKTPALNRIIKHRSITYELAELHDVPTLMRMLLPWKLSPEARAYYSRILQGIAEARGDYRSLENVFTRMRQCCSGFLAMRADDSSRIQVRFKDNWKLDNLHEFLTSRVEREKVLVFHEFRASGQFIEEMMAAAKIPHAVLRGGMRDPMGGYDRFLHDPKCRVYLLQNQLGSENINVHKVCRREVFYESPVDPKIREQAEGRVRRPHQPGRQWVHDMIAKGTVEEKILGYVKEGRDILSAVMSGAESLEDSRQ